MVTGQSGVLIMSPEPESSVSGDNILIAASLIGVTNLNSNSVKVLLDGMDAVSYTHLRAHET